MILSACSNQKKDNFLPFSLAGEWKFRIDSLDLGISEKWYTTLAAETVKLPGSMAENGKGDEVTLKTPWTGDILDRSYFSGKKYENCRVANRIL